MSRKFDQEFMNEILNILADRKLTGYDIYKKFKGRRARISPRLVYHYLHIGVKKGYLKVEKVSEEGNFSWGKSALKKYYSINVR